MMLLLMHACATDVAWTDGRGFSTVQGAIDAAASNGIVDVADGRHRGGLQVDKPLLVRGSGDTVFDAEQMTSWMSSTADLTLQDLTLHAGWAEPAPLDAAGTLTVDRVTLTDGRGPAVVRAGSGLYANEVFASSPWPTTVFEVSGDVLDLASVEVDAPIAQSVRATVADASVVDIDIVDHWGAVIAADTLTARDCDVVVATWTGELDIQHVTASRLVLRHGGTARDLHVGSLEAHAVTLERVVAERSLSLADSSLAAVLLGDGTRPVGIQATSTTIDGLLVREGVDEDVIGSMFNNSAGLTVTHMTWIGGHKSSMVRGGHILVEQSLLADVQLDAVDPDEGVGLPTPPVTTEDTFGWGDGLDIDDSELPWQRIEPQLDGLDLADDSMLWGVGADGHPGAFGGPWGDVVGELLSSR